VGRQTRPEPGRYGGGQIRADGGSPHEDNPGPDLADESAEDLREGVGLVKVQPRILDDKYALGPVGDQFGRAFAALPPDGDGRDPPTGQGREVEGLLHDFERDARQPAVPQLRPDQNLFHGILFSISDGFFTYALPHSITFLKGVHFLELPDEPPCGLLRLTADHLHVPFPV